MVSDIYETLIESSAEQPGQSADTLMLLARSLIVPRNSGIQNVLPVIIKSINRARLLRPPYRQYALAKAKEALYGIAGISSEGGAMLKEINTTRQSLSSYSNTGQPVGPYDEMFYGDKYLKNNPRGAKNDLTL